MLMGKAACYAKQIPEAVLQTTAAEAISLESFDRVTFNAVIAEIRVPEFNKLVYVFRDGRISERVWQDRSRR